MPLVHLAHLLEPSYVRTAGIAAVVEIARACARLVVEVVVVASLTVRLGDQRRQLRVPRVRDVDVRVLGVRQVVGLVIQSGALFGREQEDRGSTLSRVSTVAAYAHDGDAVLESFVHRSLARRGGDTSCTHRENRRRLRQGERRDVPGKRCRWSSSRS